jgi:hypothetical protein
MAQGEVVRARVDAATKEAASARLAEMGLTISDAFRMLLKAIAQGRPLPLDLTERPDTTGGRTPVPGTQVEGLPDGIYWGGKPSVPIEEIIGATPQRGVAPGLDLTEEEADAFMKTIEEIVANR